MFAMKLPCAVALAMATSSALVVSLPLVEIPSSYALTTAHAVRQSPLDVWDPSFGQQVSVIHGRSLVDDTLRGLLGGLAIIPGTVELSDLLLGDGKTSKGLLGSLGGLLLDVTPTNATEDTPATSTGTQSNSTAVKEAAGESYGYSLVASKKQTSRVYLMPVGQADVNSNTTLVKMLVHAVEQDENPVMMCATYGASPPTDLNVAPCTAVNATSDVGPSSSNSTGSDDQTVGQKQLFSYNRATGDLSPMFDEVPVESTQPTVDGQDVATPANNVTATSDSAQGDASQAGTNDSAIAPTTEMRMHFKAAAVTEDDEPVNESPDNQVPTPDTDHDCTDDADDEDVEESKEKQSETTQASTAAVRITLGDVQL
jgi:hypothetical protein